MHGRELVLDDDATEHAGTFHDQFFLRAGDGGRLLIGFVHKCAEQADALHGNQPRVRNFDFAATHKGHGFDGGGIALHIRLAQINLKAAHDGQDAAAFEFLAGNPALEPAENCHTSKSGIGGTGAAPAIEKLRPLRPGAVGTEARAGGLPDHQHANADDDQRPDGIEMDVCDAKIFEQQDHADREQGDAPDAATTAAAAINQHGGPGADEDHRPEIAEDVIGVDDALLIEQQHHSGSDDQRAEDEAPTVGPVATHDG